MKRRLLWEEEKTKVRTGVIALPFDVLALVMNFCAYHDRRCLVFTCRRSHECSKLPASSPDLITVHTTRLLEKTEPGDDEAKPSLRSSMKVLRPRRIVLDRRYHAASGVIA